MENNFTLSELRKECKSHGIKVKKQTLSWGAHLDFEIDGISVESVQTREHYEKNRATFEALAAIREKFKGKTMDGAKVYGL